MQKSVRIPGSVIHGVGGIDDRSITGAATEVSRECVVDVAPRWAFIGFVQSEKRHHEARGTKPALRTVAIDHRLLHGVKHSAGRFQAFNCKQFFAVQGGQELYTGIDCTELQIVAVTA